METPLYQHHLHLGAKMVPFAGWEMPLQYKGVVFEHHAVRKNVGLFDVSHMGRIHIQGKDAEKFLDYLSTNQISGKANGLAIYTTLCHERGGTVDDTIIYKLADEDYFIVANASNREKDLHHLKEQAALLNVNVKITEHFSNTGILALQGPFAKELLARFFPESENLKKMRCSMQDSLILSTTGYTGEMGFEIFGTKEQIIEWWEKLLYSGRDLGIEPIGLGARDTLRLEMGYALYGHELSDGISPSESISSWTIKWEKNDFLGKEALLNLEKSGCKRHAYGVKLLDKGIPRQGYPIFKNDLKIGEVTSGTFSPTLGMGIGLILVTKPLEVNEEIEIQIRQNKSIAQIVNLPFYHKGLKI